MTGFDGNVGDDGLAFSNTFSKVGNGQMNVFWNCSNGTALILYVDNLAHLWGVFWDGTTLTPPVELLGPGQDFRVDNDDNSDDSDDEDPLFVLFRVLWLNTAGSVDANAQARNGDALVLWVAEWEDTTRDGRDTDGTDRLFGAYFDRSAAAASLSTDAASGESLRHGFYPPVAIDNQEDSSDVFNFGFVSDSLCYSHRFYIDDSDGDDNVNQPVAELSGDPTSFAYIVWSQNQGGGERLYRLAFNLNQAATGSLSANRMPVQTSLGAGVIDVPAPFVAAGDADRDFVVHNGDMIWRIPLGGPFPSNGTLFQTRFAAGGTLETILHSTDFGGPGEITTVTELPLAENVYGGDHNLLSLYTFFTERSDASLGPDSVMAVKSDLGGTLARDVQDIDGRPDDVVDFVQATWARLPLFSGTRINRTNEWIGVFWTQTVANDSNATHVFANVVQTRHSGVGGAAARTLAQSVASAAEVPNQDVGLSVRTTNLGRTLLGGVSANAFPRVSIQSELADGKLNPAGGMQSDRFRMNLTIRINTNPGTSPGIDNLIHNGTIITLGSSSPVAAPTFAFAVPGPAPAGLIAAGTFDEQEVVADLGTPAGAPVVYFLQEDTNRDVRMYGWPFGGGAPQMLSTPGGDEEFADVNRIQTKTTPMDFNAPGNHGGDRLHVFFTEPPFVGEERSGFDAEGRTLRTRYLNKTAFAAAASTGVDAAFRTAHVPALTAPAVYLDRGLQQEETQMPSPFPTTDNEEMGPPIPFATCNAGTVGIYFRTAQTEQLEGGHLYYQEFNGTTWYQTADGEGNPQAIDVNNFETGLFPGRDVSTFIFPPRDSDDTLSGTLIFFAKPQVNDTAIGKTRRWYARVRE